MYVYIKGVTISSNEKMHTAEEIANAYGLWLNVGGNLYPNATLVFTIIEDYITEHNFKTSNYYFVDEGVIFQVYPRRLEELAIMPFIQQLQEQGITDDKEMMYKEIPFLYRQEQKKGTIVDLSEFRERRGKKDE